MNIRCLAWTAILACAAVAEGQSFTVLPASSGIFARGISGNGQVIGGSTGTFAQERPYVWRQVTGAWTRFDLPGEGGLSWGRVVALSLDGDVVVPEPSAASGAMLLGVLACRRLRAR